MLGTGFVRCTERERENGQSGASLLHACVTDFAGGVENTPQLKELAIDRLSIAAVRTWPAPLAFSPARGERTIV